MAGITMRESKKPPQPWVGNMPSHRENVIRRTGAVKNTGNDIRSNVKLTVIVSNQDPCFRAAKKPKGIPKVIDIIIAAMPN
jgi:hypothetical protein